MNCKHCNSEMMLTDQFKSDGVLFKQYMCPWCNTTALDEKYIKRQSVNSNYLKALNKKIHLRQGKIYKEFNRGYTSDLLKAYTRDGWRTSNAKCEDGVRLYDETGRIVIETPTWTEALYQLYLYHMKNLKNCNKENKINKNMQRSVISC